MRMESTSPAKVLGERGGPPEGARPVPTGVERTTARTAPQLLRNYSADLAAVFLAVVLRGAAFLAAGLSAASESDSALAGSS